MVIRVPSDPCDVKVSRKGRKPCWPGNSVMNCMLGSKEFRWVLCMFCLVDDKCVIDKPEPDPWWVGQ